MEKGFYDYPLRGEWEEGGKGTPEKVQKAPGNSRKSPLQREIDERELSLMYPDFFRGASTDTILQREIEEAVAVQQERERQYHSPGGKDCEENI